LPATFHRGMYLMYKDNLIITYLLSQKTLVSSTLFHEKEWLT